MEKPNSFFIQKNTIILEVIVVVLVAVAGYFLYKSLPADTATVEVSPSEAVLGAELTLLIKSIEGENISFENKNILDNDLVKNFIDFSEVISTSTERGKEDPFSP